MPVCECAWSNLRVLLQSQTVPENLSVCTTEHGDCLFARLRPRNTLTYLLKLRIHDATGCTAGCTTGCIVYTGFYSVTFEVLFVQCLCIIFVVVSLHSLHV